MNPITIVLDESCAHLRSAVAELAPVQVFQRTSGFLERSRIAARELQQLLTEHSLLGRAIYVSQSFGCFTALLHAYEYREVLLGILLLDPSHPRQGPEALRILSDAPSNSEVERLRSLLAGFGPAWEESCREVSELRDLGDISLHVLAGARFDLISDLPNVIKEQLIQSRHTMLAEYCRLSTNSTFVLIDSAGHDISHQSPDAVLSAIKRILDAKESEPKKPVQRTGASARR